MTRNFLADLFTPRALSRVAALAGTAALLACAPAVAAGANDPYGVWLRPEGGVQFSFYDCGGLLCAKVIAAKKPEDQSAIGTVILRGASQTGPNEWKGKLYNSDDGKIYDGFISVKSPTELTLKGCLWGVLCSGETWKRVASPAASPAKPQTHAMADQLK